MNHVQNNSKKAKRSDVKSIYDSPELLNFYIKKQCWNILVMKLSSKQN